jgi:uncharacterized protein YqhQ
MPNSLDNETQFIRRPKPGSRRKTIKKIIGNPLYNFSDNYYKQLKNALDRIPYVQGLRMHTSSSKKDIKNPIYQKPMYGNSKRSRKNKNKNKNKNKTRKYK